VRVPNKVITIDTHPAFVHDLARAMFQADPSSKMEADWDNLAPYKRHDWMRIAEVKILREGLTPGQEVGSMVPMTTTQQDNPMIDIYNRIPGPVLRAARDLCADAGDLNPEYVRGQAELLIDCHDYLTMDEHKEALIAYLGSPL
jgi:hypothetical protein